MFKLPIQLDNLALRIFGRKSLSIQLDITNACNLSCRHCYHHDHKNAGNLDLRGWRLVLDQYQDLLNSLKARPNITICGGEPLVSPMFFQLAEEISNRWPDALIGVMTNGTRVRPLIHKLKRHPLFFQISLESPYEDEHDKIRGKGTYSAALDGLKLLLDHKFETSILVILSRRTAAEVDAMFELASRLNVSSLNYTRAIGQGSGQAYFSGRDHVLEGLALKNAIENVIRSSRAHAVVTNTDKPLFALVDELAAGGSKPGFDGLVVGYRGDIKASSRSDLVLGNVNTETLRSVYYGHPVFRSLRNGEILKCGECKFFRRCGGDRNVAYANTGNFLAEDNGCWL